MSIHINKPYRIIPPKEKRYNAHYNIPSANCVVVPLKQLGDEVLCDIRWEDSNGEMQVLHNKMFIVDNLIPLNEMLHVNLHEIWNHYYNRPQSIEIAN